LAPLHAGLRRSEVGGDRGQHGLRVDRIAASKARGVYSLARSVDPPLQALAVAQHQRRKAGLQAGER
jgi:hypothetical protein